MYIIIVIGGMCMNDEFVRKTIKLNRKLWDKFQAKIEDEYGTTYNHTSEEIRKAIENYVDEDVVDVEKTKSKINNLNVENKNLRNRIVQLEEDNVKISDELLLSKTSSRKDSQKIDNLEKKLLSEENENKILSEKIESLEREYDSLKKDNDRLNKENNELRDDNKRLEENYFKQVEETNRQIKEYNKVKNKREHAQERLNKTQDELNDTLKRLEKYSFAIGQVKNMSFLDRLFNRLPEEIKTLQPGKNEEVVDD